MTEPTPAPASPPPVRPLLSATIMLLRDDRGALEVFMVQRHHQIDFATGALVFPGGKTDASDADPALRGCCAGVDGLDDAQLALRVCAVRETFEECGVLLAGPRVPDGLDRHRADVVARRRSFGEVLAAEGLVLRADLLHAWARWITPPVYPRRYDTAFFVALVPDGQEADAHTTEAVEALWWHPDEALERWQEDEMKLMPPTARTLQEIAGFTDCAEVLAAAPTRVIRPITPVVRRDGDRLVSVLPDDTVFPAAGLA